MTSPRQVARLRRSPRKGGSPLWPYYRPILDLADQAEFFKVKADEVRDNSGSDPVDERQGDEVPEARPSENMEILSRLILGDRGGEL